MSMKQGKLEPQLRFSKFTNHWSKQNLGELCDKIQDGNYGESYPKSDDFLETGIPFLTSKAISKTGEIIKSKVDYISPEKHTQLAKAHLKINDVLFTNRGANVGVIGFVDSTISNGNIGPQLTLLRANRKVILPLFLKYYMNTYAFQKQVHSQDSGSAMNFFGIGETKKFIIYVPLIAEQEKIASFLGAVDTRISQLRRKHELLQTYKRSVMQKIFSQQIRFKGDEGQPFPDWEYKELGEVLHYEQPTNYLVSNTEYNDLFPTPVLTAGKTFLLGYSNEIDNIFCKLPTIIFDDFTTAFKFVDFPFKAKSSAMKMLVPKNKDVNIKYIFEVMNTLKFSLGEEHKRYWISEYQYLEIPYPNTQEQEKIAEFLIAIDQKIEAITKQIELTEKLKKGLLQKMFV